MEPRNYLIVGALAVLRAGGHAKPPYDLVARSCRGQRAGHRHIRVPQELGTPLRFHLCEMLAAWGCQTQKPPAAESASDSVGVTNAGARGGHRHVKENETWRVGREGFGAPHSTVESGERGPREPGGGKGVSASGPRWGNQGRSFVAENPVTVT